MPDNVGAMFYYGDVPWHGKGKKLDKPADPHEALVHGGLNWQVDMVPLQTDEFPASPVKQRVAVVRSDCPPGHPDRVLGVVHPGFRPLQNEEGIELFDTLIGRKQRVYHTGGYLGNGEVVWVLARLPVEIRVRGKDVVEPYMLFTNSHNGSIAIDFRLTTIRVVCRNTLSLAFKPANSRFIFKHAHEGNYEALKERAEEFFKLSLDATTALERRFREMDRAPLAPDQVNSYFETLIPLPTMPPRAQTNERVRKSYEQRLAQAKEMRAGITHAFAKGIKDGVDVPPCDPTVWGALNAVTAYVDHAQRINGDRYAHILFGAGASLKKSAYELAIAYLQERGLANDPPAS